MKPITPIIVMLCCLEVYINISNINITTTGFDEYRELLEVDGIANGILAMIQGRVMFSCKDG